MKSDVSRETQGVESGGCDRLARTVKGGYSYWWLGEFQRAVMCSGPKVSDTPALRVAGVKY